MKKRVLIVLCSLFGLPTIVLADGTVVDKVYHPYVQAWERDIEYRFAFQEQPHHEDNNAMSQKLGYSQSIADRVTLGGFIIVERVTPEDYTVNGFELEVRWMLTEQGQYAADWGLFFEFERKSTTDSYELNSGLIMEKEFGPTSLTLNALLVYEWGGELESEVEPEFRAQYRYRILPQIQPAVELYMGEGFQGAGPSLLGVQKFDKQKQLKWEFGVVFAIDKSSINNTLRFTLEYEF